MIRRNQIAVRVAGVAVLALSAGGCTALDTLLSKVPFFSFMQESPAFDPYEAPRPAPVGAVPFAAPHPQDPIRPPAGPVTEQFLQSLTERLDNPVPATPESIEKGRQLYQTYCFVCHGAEGAGNGPAVGPGRIPFALPIVGERAESLSDEYYYGIIGYGRGLMPAYGGRVTPDERWHIVNYIRQLQRGTAAGQAQPSPAGR